MMKVLKVTIIIILSKVEVENKTEIRSKFQKNSWSGTARSFHLLRVSKARRAIGETIKAI